jgi:ABC-type polysaccharide/polyol phosphate export permease
MNLIVLGVFFVVYKVIPSFEGILMFVLYSILLYILIVSFSILTSTLFVRFRDLGTIWEVILSVLMYASPIIYPLSMLPDKFHSFVLMNPLAFIIHYSKQGAISGIFSSPDKFIILFVCILLIAVLSFLVFRKYERRVAEFV